MVRQRLDQFQPRGEMGDCLLIGTVPQGILPRVGEIVDSTPGIASTRKMHCQLRSNLPGLHPITDFLASPDLLMQAHPVPGRYARIHHLVIQGMDELIARRNRPIGPGLGAPGPDEPPLAGQGRRARFERLGSLRYARRHGRHGKCAPGHTGSFQERLIGLRQLLEVLLDILPQAGGDDFSESR
jgi:hypothetical protein